MNTVGHNDVSDIHALKHMIIPRQDVDVLAVLVLGHSTIFRKLTSSDVRVSVIFLVQILLVLGSPPERRDKGGPVQRSPGQNNR